MNFGNTLLTTKDNWPQMQQMGAFDWASAITDPEKFVQAYKGEAYKIGTKLVLIQAAAFAFLVYIIIRNTKVRTT